MKKRKNTLTSEMKKVTIMENKVRVVAMSGFTDFDLSTQYYIMYFVDISVIAIFKGDHSKIRKVELPHSVIRLKSLRNVNYRIPQKLNDISFELTENEKRLSLRFHDESIKNELGDKIKKMMKDEEALKREAENGYTDIELKYKIAKILESMYFELFKDNYDYRRLLSFEYLNKFSQMYNNKSEDYKYLYNRLYMGKVAVINKKSNLIRKEI